MNDLCAESPRRDEEFRQRDDVERQRSNLKVIRSPQRSRSVDLRYDAALTGGLGYRQLSRCWYDVAVARDAVARAAVANGYREQQQQQQQQQQQSPARSAG